MKKLLRMFRRFVIALILVAVVAMVCSSVLVRMLVSRESLIEMAETEINSRVEIGDLKINLWRFPARIVLRDVALAPRDAEVAKPPGARERPARTPVRVKEVRLAVGLPALLCRKVEVREFVFLEPHCEVTVFEDGTNSLDELLRAPGEEEPSVPERSGSDAGGGDDAPEVEVASGGSLNVYTHGFMARLHNVRVEGASADLILEKSGARFVVWDLDAELDEIEIDPAALEKTNEARLWVRGILALDAANQESLRFAELHLDGLAKARLIDPATGDLEPELTADLAIGEASYLLARTPVVQKVWGALRKLRAIGIELGELPERAYFGRSRAVAVHYHRERFTLLKTLSVWIKDWEVAVVEESWIQTETEMHAASAEIVAGEKFSRGLRKQVDKGIGLLPESLRGPLEKEVDSALFREGRLVAKVASAGELSDPRVSMMTRIPDLQDALRGLREAIPGLAEELFKRL